MKIEIHAPQMTSEITGTDRFAHNVLRELRDLDLENEYTVECLAGNDYVASAVTDTRFKVERYDHNRLRNVRALPARLGRSLTRSRRDADVFYSFHNLYSPLRKACPIVVTVLDLAPLATDYYHPSRLVRMVSRHNLRKAVRDADRFVAISEFSKRTLLERFGIQPERIAKVHLAAASHFRHVADEAQLESVRRRYGLPSRFLLTAGATDPRKNVASVVQAYRQLPADLREEFGLVVFGKDWHGRSSEAWGSAPQNGVRVIGYVDDEDLPALYTLADAFVFASLYEGFGLPPLEAMRCGTPVVCSSAASLPEVVGDAAVLVDPRDVGSIREAVEALLRNEERRRELEDRGATHVERFSWRATAARILEVITSAARNGARKAPLPSRSLAVREAAPPGRERVR
jgi:glycosyltransferase involved in cell wall biosynthesis